MLQDRIAFTFLYALFSIGVILLIRYFPGMPRLVRGYSISGYRKNGEELLKEIKNIQFIKNIREDRIDRAIYEDLSYLKNLIIAHKGMVNSDYVISCLASRESILKKGYIRMLSYMRTGRVQEAEQVMYRETGTEMGKELAFLLTSWEYMEPEQLEEVIISYRRSIKETCITRQKKREEIISDFVYLPATVNVFLIFINFIYVSYFMEQQELFGLMF